MTCLQQSRRLATKKGMLPLTVEVGKIIQIKIVKNAVDQTISPASVVTITTAMHRIKPHKTKIAVIIIVIMQIITTSQIKTVVKIIGRKLVIKHKPIPVQNYFVDTVNA
jgi:hypothetical protein